MFLLFFKFELDSVFAFLCHVKIAYLLGQVYNPSSYPIFMTYFSYLSQFKLPKILCECCHSFIFIIIFGKTYLNKLTQKALLFKYWYLTYWHVWQRISLKCNTFCIYRKRFILHRDSSRHSNIFYTFIYKANSVSKSKLRFLLQK